MVCASWPSMLVRARSSARDPSVYLRAWSFERRLPLALDNNVRGHGAGGGKRKKQPITNPAKAPARTCSTLDVNGSFRRAGSPRTATGSVGARIHAYASTREHNQLPSAKNSCELSAASSVAGRMSEQQIHEADQRAAAAQREREDQLARMRQVRAEYDALSETLKVLPDRVERAVMVPFGKMALFHGHLRHTNEVTVLLGENIFALRSASQAVGVAERRAEFVQKQVDNLVAELASIKAQREKLSAMRTFGLGGGGSGRARRLGGGAWEATSGLVTNPDGTVEIREEFDEAEWNQGNRGGGGSSAGGTVGGEMGGQRRDEGSVAGDEGYGAGGVAGASPAPSSGDAAQGGVHERTQVARPGNLASTPQRLPATPPGAATAPEAFNQKVLERSVDQNRSSATPILEPTRPPNSSCAAATAGLPGKDAEASAVAGHLSGDGARVSRFKASRQR